MVRLKCKMDNSIIIYNDSRLLIITSSQGEAGIDQRIKQNAKRPAKASKKETE